MLQRFAIFSQQGNAVKKAKKLLRYFGKRHVLDAKLLR